MERVVERWVRVDGARLWAISSEAPRERGSALPLLLCAGGPGCCDYLAPVAAMLDDLVEVWRFEQRGCGRSDPSPRYDVAQCLADVDAIRCAAAAERWLVGGHSWGANLALAHALAHPGRVAGVLYVAGNGLQNDREWSRAYHAALAARGEREPDYAFPTNRDVNEQVVASWRVFLQQPTLWRRVAALRVPVLVVVAGRDIRPSWPAEQLAALLPNAELVRLAHAEHCIWLDDPGSAAALRLALRRFVAPIVGERP